MSRSSSSPDEQLPASSATATSSIRPDRALGGLRAGWDGRFTTQTYRSTSVTRDRAQRGRSTTTLVALTTATASTPGSRLNSSTASADSRETTRWGPAWISTCAITPVAHYPGDQPGEAVACRQRRAVSLLGGSLGGLGGQVLGEPGQIRSGDRAVATGGPAGGQAPGIRPTSDRVRADPQESRGFADTKLVHTWKSIKKARIRTIRASVRAGARVRP